VGCSCPVGVGPGRRSRCSSRGALAVPASWPGCCRCPARPGSAPACRLVVLPAAGPAVAQRAVSAGWCWILSTLSLRSAGCVLAAGGPRGLRRDAGRGAAGVLSAWPHRQRCGRVFAAGSVFGMMNLVCCRARSGRGRPGLSPRIREWEDPHESAVFRGRRCCPRRRICSGPRTRVMSSKPPQLGSESA
jgi:hypothetical protein